MTQDASQITPRTSEEAGRVSDAIAAPDLGVPRGREQYDPDAALRARIESDFSYHPPRDGQPEKYEAIRFHAKALAALIVELVPHSREQSTALTRLEEAAMHANAGIARHG